IQEVAILFLGIFATMIPALDWLEIHARSLAGPSPGFFYWGCGLLSSLLDNAPTYLSFLSATFGLFVDSQVVGQIQHFIQNADNGAAGLELPHSEPIQHAIEALQKYHAGDLATGKIGPEQIQTAFLLGNNGLNVYLIAISIAAVFFGANTYIGNGPNFMVKSIADHQKVRTPTFFGFIFQYTIPCMAPMLVLVWLIFFRK